jgi:hypothetical protein
MNDRSAATLRRIARRYRRLGKMAAGGYHPAVVNEGATELSREFLAALGGYELAANFLTFATGPLQQAFVQTYEAEISADSDRTVLGMYDNPDTRKRAVMMAAQTGRIIELDAEGTHWQFRDARDPVDLMQWTGREGITERAPIHAPSIQGLRAQVQADAHHFEGQAPEQEKEEPGGQYL